MDKYVLVIAGIEPHYWELLISKNLCEDAGYDSSVRASKLTFSSSDKRSSFIAINPILDDFVCTTYKLVYGEVVSGGKLIRSIII